jgi:hypothetical protein
MSPTKPQPAPPYRGRPQARREHIEQMFHLAIEETPRGLLVTYLGGRRSLWIERGRSGWFEEWPAD